MPESGYARSWLLLSLVVMILDQLTKWWVSSHFELYESLPVLPVFNVTLVHNAGAAFSFLSDAGGWQRWFFIVLSLVVSIVLFFWLWRLHKSERLHAVSLSLVLGGALGNLVDRIHLGYVIDFIDIYYDKWHWPVFNVADSAITAGVMLLVIDLLFFNTRAQCDDG